MKSQKTTEGVLNMLIKNDSIKGMDVRKEGDMINLKLYLFSEEADQLFYFEAHYSMQLIFVEKNQKEVVKMILNDAAAAEKHLLKTQKKT